ncbi:hypothetical protein [Xanthomonas phaseoli]|uniref:hypothetical protein n=1 Tax=Xanthomonas phaseoli TaxID=1985254 RepID=UPI00031322B4|nr:hypothetical protein [Xanthomonas phaseoli]UEQ17051.1 hypothetical protein K9838_10825 [Xanthomonas phaseoli pv. manihotis]
MIRVIFFAVLLLIGFTEYAFSAEPPNGGSFGDQGAAFAACNARGEWWLSNTRPSVPSAQYDCRRDDQPPDAGVYRLWLSADMPYAPTSSFVFPLRNSCAARPASTSGWSALGNGASCNDGCAMGPATSADTFSAGGKTYFSLVGAKPTGATCSYGDGTGQGVKDQDCVQSGTLTMCIRSDGKQCATASTGKQFCWSPGESGVKKADNNNQAATKSPENAAINAPKDAPSNGGDWKVTGQGTSSETRGGVTTNSNVTTFDSTYGKDGSGKGDGTGSGTDSGGGDGDGEEGDGDDPGAGAPMGDLYTKSDKTVESVVSKFAAQVRSTPIAGGIASFMTVPSGGSCPVFTLGASKWWSAMTIDFHCSGTFLGFLRACGWVILAIAAYAAIRIAVT